ncbi:AsmA family protein [Algibacter mikhailovii]|uniref:AsmA family protein n=1 Tax=Algibacter mikhailovii TaxID=425498 RepID=UPI00249529A0|nr:AsmA family protein [Algibacter mikhailovii]
MKQRVLKILKIAGITIISIVFLLVVAIGVVFEFVLTPEKITPKVVEAVNKNLNAKLSIEAVELTFFKTFPNFKLELEKGFILTRNDSIQEFNSTSKDTLISFDYGVVSVNPIAFLNNSINVTKFSFENPNIYAFVSEAGEVNWDILKENKQKDSIQDQEIKDEKFNANINLEDISIINGNLVFDDHYSANFMRLQGFDMDLSAEYNEKDIILALQAQSDNLIFRKKGNTYTDQLSLMLNTDFHVNRSTKVIDLKNAKVGINDIQFVTEGTLYPNRVEKQIDVDLHLDLEVPTLNTLIDLVPEVVFDKTDNYTAEGDVSIEADIKGVYKKGVIPEINAHFKIHNGSISYKDLPNQIELIEADIKAYISPEINTGSNFDINNVTLRGVGTEINIKGKGDNLFDNADLDISIDGKIDLEALEKSFPFKKNLNLAGAGEIHIRSMLNINDIRNQDYGKIQALGTLNMNQIVFENETDSLYFVLDKADIHIEQDQNSKLLTDQSTKVTGGKIFIQKLQFKDGKESSGDLDQLDIKFATTAIKDSTKIAVMKAAVLIKGGDLKLGDSLRAKLKLVNANISIEPDKHDQKIPKIHSVFKIDSTGIKSKGRFFAISKGAYELTTIRNNKNWPINGHISFDQLYAYTPTFPLLLKMPQTKITFEPGVISLDHAKLEIGDSDIEATGKVYKIGEAFFDDKIFKGELEVNASLIDFNQFVQAINDGVRPVEKSEQEILAQNQNSKTSESAEQPKSFVVPEKLDLSLKSRFNKLKYKNFIIDDVGGVITVKDQKIDLANLEMTTMAAKMTTSAAYTSKEAGVATLDFDFKIFDIDLSKLTELLPVLDTLLPMVDSFEGKVDARMRGNTKIDKNLDMTAASMDAIARVTGTNLVVLNGKTFEKMSKMLFFKNKDKNVIDTLEFAMVFKNKQIEIFPSMVTVDRYKVAIGGHHNLDLTYDYHVSILKSPMPFKAGIDLKGTEEDMDFKITKAKYKNLFSTKARQQKKADTAVINRKNYVLKSLPF